MHFVGSLVEGEVPAGGLNLNYNVGLGNGRGQVISRGGRFRRHQQQPRLAGQRVRQARTALRPAASAARFTATQLNPLTAPAGARVDPIGAHRVDEGDAGIHRRVRQRQRISRSAAATDPEQPGILRADRVPAAVGCRRRWKPYYRFEYIHVPRADAIFRDVVPAFHASTVGLRYDITNFAAFKLEYRDYAGAICRPSTASSRRRASRFRPMRNQTIQISHGVRCCAVLALIADRARLRAEAGDIAIVVRPDVPVDNLTLRRTAAS